MRPKRRRNKEPGEKRRGMEKGREGVGNVGGGNEYESRRPGGGILVWCARVLVYDHFDKVDNVLVRTSPHARCFTFTQSAAPSHHHHHDPPTATPITILISSVSAINLTRNCATHFIKDRKCEAGGERRRQHPTLDRVGRLCNQDLNKRPDATHRGKSTSVIYQD